MVSMALALHVHFHDLHFEDGNLLSFACMHRIHARARNRMPFCQLHCSSHFCRGGGGGVCLRVYHIVCSSVVHFHFYTPLSPQSMIFQLRPLLPSTELCRFLPCGGAQVFRRGRRGQSRRIFLVRRRLVQKLTNHNRTPISMTPPPPPTSNKLQTTSTGVCVT